MSVPLWHLFFMDLPDFNGYIFMDDLCVFGNNKAAVQEDLDELAIWAQSNSLVWNYDKCVVLPVRLGKRPSLSLDGVPLKVVSTTRYLGVLLSSNPDPESHGFSFHDEDNMKKSNESLN